MRLGFGLYVIPLALVATPQLLGTEGVLLGLVALVKVAVGLYALSYALIGKGWGKRIGAGVLGAVAVLAPLPF